MAHKVLRLDVNGSPMEWLDALDATYYYAKGLVAWTYGEPFVVLHGGRNREGVPTEMEIHPVIANRGALWRNMPTPPLTNPALFQRDEHTCLYCGGTFRDSELTREHILPQAQGGPDTWMNTVAACTRCNSRKANRTPEKAGMPLLAVPYVPNQAEYLFLMRHRRVLGCQMELLRNRFRSTRILEQTRNWREAA